MCSNVWGQANHVNLLACTLHYSLSSTLEDLQPVYNSKYQAALCSSYVLASHTCNNHFRPQVGSCQAKNARAINQLCQPLASDQAPVCERVLPLDRQTCVMHEEIP